MQNRFVGDIGDFGKYGLLRFMCGHPGEVNPTLPLGVVWYLNGDGDTGGDDVGYLFRDFPPTQCDGPLYQHLRALLCQNNRTVVNVQNAGILPVPANDYCIVAVPRVANFRQRNQQRINWITDACAAMGNNVHLLFLDPDTGIRPRGPRNPPHEYVQVNEIQYCLQTNKSLVVYQHASRNPRTDPARIGAILEEINRPIQETRMFAWYSRYFVIIPANEAHRQILWNRLDQFRASNWYGVGRFQEVTIPNANPPNNRP